MLKLAGKGENIEENKNKIEECIKEGLAYNKFIELVEKQGGDISYINDVNKFEKAKYSQDIVIKSEGYIKEIRAEQIGKAACYLGAGRVKKEDSIDMLAGIILNYKVGDYIKKEEILATLYTNDKTKIDEAKKIVENAIAIVEEPVEKIKMILDVI